MTAKNIAIAAALAATTGGAQGAWAVELASHRATYQLEMVEVDAVSGIDGVEGALEIVWRRDCAAYVTEQRLAFTGDVAGGGAFTYAVDFYTEESLDERSLAFDVTVFDGGVPVSSSKGAAVLDQPGGAGSVQFVEPKAIELPLPAGTIFPTEHMRRLIETARGGGVLSTAQVFDGSGMDGLAEATGVIGQTAGVDDRWSVSLAYHAIDATDGLPIFESVVELREDGVLEALRLDYGDFILRGELAELELVGEARDCG